MDEGLRGGDYAQMNWRMIMTNKRPKLTIA